MIRIIFGKTLRESEVEAMRSSPWAGDSAGGQEELEPSFGAQPLSSEQQAFFQSLQAGVGSAQSPAKAAPYTPPGIVNSFGAANPHSLTAKAELERLTQQLTVMEVKLDRVGTQLLVKEQELMASRRGVSDLQAKLVESTAEVQRLSVEKDAQQRRLVAERQQQEQAMGAQTASAVRAGEQVSLLCRENEALKARVEELQDTLVQIPELQDKVNELQATLRRECQAYKKEAARLEAELTLLKSAPKQAQQLEVQVKALTVKNQSLKTSLTEERGRFRQYCQEKETAISRLKSQQAELAAENQRLARAEDSLLLKLDDRVREIEALKQSRQERPAGFEYCRMFATGAPGGGIEGDTKVRSCRVRDRRERDVSYGGL